MTNSNEVIIGTNLLLQDTDCDGLSDYDEVNCGRDPGSYVPGQDLSPLEADTDGDGFNGYEETVNYDTDPLDIDSVSDPGPVVGGGDLNADGVVDARDHFLAQQIIWGGAELSPDYLERGYVAPLIDGVADPDGAFNLGDVLVIQRKVLGLVNF